MDLFAKPDKDLMTDRDVRERSTVDEDPLSGQIYGDHIRLKQTAVIRQMEINAYVQFPRGDSAKC